MSGQGGFEGRGRMSMGTVHQLIEEEVSTEQSPPAPLYRDVIEHDRQKQ